MILADITFSSSMVAPIAGAIASGVALFMINQSAKRRDNDRVALEVIRAERERKVAETLERLDAAMKKHEDADNERELAAQKRHAALDKTLAVLTERLKISREQEAAEPISLPPGR